MDTIDGLSSLTHQCLSEAVLGREHLLFHRLDRNIACLGTGRRLANCLGIYVVIFIAGDVRFHMLRSYKFHLVAEGNKLPGEPM